MAQGEKCGLDCGSGTEIDTVAPTVIHTVPVADPGKNRGHYIHLDLINSGNNATDVTLVADGLTMVISVPTKSTQQIDFFVLCTAVAQEVTAQAAAADVFALGFHEHW